MAIDGLERFPSARDIEKVARNPECQTLRTALAANIDLRKYAVERLNLPEERQSPIAIARGQQVERRVLGENGKILIERLLADGRLLGAPKVLDLSGRAKNRAGMAKAAQQTDECIARLVARQPVPALIIHPVLSVPLGEDIQYIEPDGLVLFSGAIAYEPVELKSYAYRAGRTDTEKLLQARRQGAVYVLTLRGRMGALGGNPATVAARVTLVFMRPNSLYPEPIYSESVEGEMRDVEHAVELLNEARREIPSLKGNGREIADVLPELPYHYTERCLSFCSLAKDCRNKARVCQSVAVLGEDCARILAPAGTVVRALSLIRGAKPGDIAEQSLAARLGRLSEMIGEFRRTA